MFLRICIAVHQMRLGRPPPSLHSFSRSTQLCRMCMRADTRMHFLLHVHTCATFRRFFRSRMPLPQISRYLNNCACTCTSMSRVCCRRWRVLHENVHACDHGPNVQSRSAPSLNAYMSVLWSSQMSRCMSTTCPPQNDWSLARLTSEYKLLAGSRASGAH